MSQTQRVDPHRWSLRAAKDTEKATSSVSSARFGRHATSAAAPGDSAFTCGRARAARAVGSIGSYAVLASSALASGLEWRPAWFAGSEASLLAAAAVFRPYLYDAAAASAHPRAAPVAAR